MYMKRCLKQRVVFKQNSKHYIIDSLMATLICLKSYDPVIDNNKCNTVSQQRIYLDTDNHFIKCLMYLIK